MPSLATESPLDVKIKRGLTTDVMKKLCLNVRRKERYKQERRAKLTNNLVQLNNNADQDGDKKHFKEDYFKHDEIKKIEKEKDQ